MKLDRQSIPGLKVTVMGLGLHGGGAASARFFAEHGADVTVTDLRDEKTLAPSLQTLSDLPLRFVLGTHVESDFSAADIVVKNPAVAPTSPFLRAARRVETDISIYLALSRNPLLAVTGTKGKSTTASAMFSVLRRRYPEARLGGNITVSPLTFLDAIAPQPSVPVVLELSSWQLADLRGRGILTPRVAVLTTILPDHLNRYASMDEYVNDKRVIYQEQRETDFTICRYDDPYGRTFAAETPARPIHYAATPLPPALDGGWLSAPDGPCVRRTPDGLEEIVRAESKLPGEHNRLNLLASALALTAFGMAAGEVADGLAAFEGIGHRLQRVGERDGVVFYNDSAATIPEATVAAIDSFTNPVIVIFGGTDKNLDFSVLAQIRKPPKAAVLLQGSAAAKAGAAMAARGVTPRGPFDSMEAAVDAAVAAAAPEDVIVLSPGCASFEMFRNEFDRGDRFVGCVRALLRTGSAT